MFTVTNKINGRTVDVCTVRGTDINGEEKLLFGVYNEDSGEWEMRLADNYSTPNADEDIFVAKVSSIADFEEAMNSDMVRTIYVESPLTLSEDVLEFSNLSNKTIHDLTLTATITNSNIVPATYALQVEQPSIGGTISVQTGYYEAGTSIPVSIQLNEGYALSVWGSSNGGAFANNTALSTTFTMPANDVTIRAIITNTETGEEGPTNPAEPLPVRIEPVPTIEDLTKAFTLINCDNITFVNANITLSMSGLETWAGAYVVHLYECSNIKFQGNTVLTGGNTSMLCNDTYALAFEDSVKFIDSTFGGIELTKGVNANRFLTSDLILHRDITEFYYSEESRDGRPIIYSDGLTSYGFHNNSAVDLIFVYDYAKQQSKYFTK